MMCHCCMFYSLQCCSGRGLDLLCVARRSNFDVTESELEFLGTPRSTRAVWTCPEQQGGTSKDFVLLFWPLFEEDGPILTKILQCKWFWSHQVERTFASHEWPYWCLFVVFWELSFGTKFFLPEVLLIFLMRGRGRDAAPLTCCESNLKRINSNGVFLVKKMRGPNRSRFL